MYIYICLYIYIYTYIHICIYTPITYIFMYIYIYCKKHIWYAMLCIDAFKCIICSICVYDCMDACYLSHTNCQLYIHSIYYMNINFTCAWLWCLKLFSVGVAVAPSQLRFLRPQCAWLTKICPFTRWISSSWVQSCEKVRWQSTQKGRWLGDGREEEMNML